MSLKDPEKRKAYARERYAANKDAWKNPDGTWKKAKVSAEVRNERSRKKWREDLQWRVAILAKRRQTFAARRLIGTCPICGLGPLPLVRDHCHRTGRDRGKICHACNLMLGFARDNQETLAMAIDYLERNTTKGS